MPIASNSRKVITGNTSTSDGNMLFASTKWRIEVVRSGLYWQWRKGSGSERVSKYGGKFSTLTDERKAQYAQNRITHARTGARNIAAVSDLLPIGGDYHATVSD